MTVGSGYDSSKRKEEEEEEAEDRERLKERTGGRKNLVVEMWKDIKVLDFVPLLDPSLPWL